MPIKLTQKQVVIIGAIIGLIVLIALVIMFGTQNSQKGPTYTLNFWGTDSIESWQNVISAYQAANPGITINYQQIPSSNYYSTILNALAAGKGPDIFMLNNRQILENLSILAPNPYLKSINPTMLATLFPDAVSDNLIINNLVYGLPIDMDTLALFYNSKLFNNAGVATPPSTWSQAEALVPVFNQIKVSAIALGTADNIPHASDILINLMMQYGAQMANLNSGNYQASFDQSLNNNPQTSSFQPGLDAFNFYLNFSNPHNSDYDWNNTMANAYDAFASNNLAMTFGYYSDLQTIKSKSPYLNFQVAPMLQVNLNSPITYPRYDVLVASKQSRLSNYAWSFIYFAATTPSAIESYLTSTNKLPALRSLIAQGINSSDYSISIFNRQALTAKSWLIPNNSQVDNIFDQAINNAINNISDPQTIISQAASQITALARNINFELPNSNQ